MFCSKLAAALLIAAVSAASADRPRRHSGRPPNAARLGRLVSRSRRLEDQEQQQQEGGNGAGAGDIDLSFLNDYSLKLLKCTVDESTVQVDDNADADANAGGVIIFRLCPSDACDSDSKTGGCSEGYGDYAVDIATYVAAYLEDQIENLNWNDDQNENNDDLDQLAQCAQYNGMDYYVGPTCTDDGRGVRLAVFDDQYCSDESNVDFAEISNGWNLPFADGGLVSENCIACLDQNNNNNGNNNGDDDGNNGEEGGICVDLYESAPYKCEREMDVKHYYWDQVTEIYRFGQNKVGCNFINGVEARRSKPTPWGEVLFVIFLLLVSVGAGYAYTVWWRKRRETLKHIEDELSEASMSVDSRNSSASGPRGTLL